MVVVVPRAQGRDKEEVDGEQTMYCTVCTYVRTRYLHYCLGQSVPRQYCTSMRSSLAGLGSKGPWARNVPLGGSQD